MIFLFVDSSPRSSPRTPLENSHTSQLSHLISTSKNVNSIESFSRSTGEDDNYSTVDYTLKSNILQNDSTSTTAVLEEEEKYSTIRESQNESTELVEEDKYSTIRTNRSDISQNDDNKYAVVSENMKSSILQNELSEGSIHLEDIGFRPPEEIPPLDVTPNNPESVPEDFPDYAVVDLKLKRQYREEKSREVKEEQNKCKLLSCVITFEISKLS